MQAYSRAAVALLLAALPVSGWAQAPQPKPTFEERFAAANTSHNGCLTFEEARAAHLAGVVKQFTAIDLARHGCITLPDIKAYRKGTRNLED